MFKTPEDAIAHLRTELSPDVNGDEYLTAAWAFLDGWMTAEGPQPEQWGGSPRDAVGPQDGT